MSNNSPPWMLSTGIDPEQEQEIEGESLGVMLLINNDILMYPPDRSKVRHALAQMKETIFLSIQDYVTDNHSLTLTILWRHQHTGAMGKERTANE
jgi:hypothetical protein